MPIAIAVLFGALFTVLTCVALGRLLLRRLVPGLNREEELPLAFVAGSALLSLIVFLLCAAHLAYSAVCLAVGAAAIGAAWRTGVHRSLPERFSPLPPPAKWTFLAGFTVFTALYFVNAMAPECSADGASYHLSFVARYLREHGFVRLPYNLYAQLSQGVEMLFTFAFAFGRHSAAALVHDAFLVALALLILSYGRRIGQPMAGAAAALFVYASPVVGIDGTSAYVDVAVAAILFAGFYVLEVWDERRSTGMLVVVGLLAGFGYAAKYTAFLAAPYAVGYVLLRARKPRPALLVGACSLALVAPWVAKNLVYTGNPVSPMMNALFPNPIVNPIFERDWSKMLASYQTTSRWQIPWELTVRGEKLPGIIGPVFLLLPLALSMLRTAVGRRLLIPALLYSAPFAANIGARFFIPPLPFWALSLALVFAGWPRLLAALTVLAAISDWPAVTRRYASRNVWMLEAKFPVPAALRIEGEDHWLGRKHVDYVITRVIEAKTPPDARIFAMNAIPEAYTQREIAVGFQSSRGESLRDTLFGAFSRDFQPGLRVSLKFPAQRFARRVRVVSADPPAADREWMVNELRLFSQAKEIPRSDQWRLTARPHPWDVQMAFDNNAATRWRAWQTVTPRAYIEIQAPQPMTLDEVVLETNYGQTGLKFRVEVEDRGEWRTVECKASETAMLFPGFLGRAALAELKERGFGYLLMDIDRQPGKEMAESPKAWGVTELGREGQRVLYRIDVTGPQLQ